jgi:hypothetical protein
VLSWRNSLLKGAHPDENRYDGLQRLLITSGTGAGNLFGLAVKPGGDAVYVVDDFGAADSLQLFR